MRTTSTRVAYENRWMTVREDEVVHADGSPGLFGVVEKEDFSIVVPAHNDGFFLVEQYRYPVGGRFWEFPAGTPSAPGSGLSAQEVAADELREETGITAATWEPLGIIHEAYGYSTPRGHIYLASDLSFGEPDREPSEADMRVAWFDLDGIWDLVSRGLLTDAPTLAALAFVQRRLAAPATSP
jgi:8-oxo-dGTP pyrophosphatase MutT (NUDIX family)